jgi:ribonuclease HI
VKLTVFIDGAVEPVNPGGTGACAMVVYVGEVGGRESDPRPAPLKAGAKLIGSGAGMTNNVAEYRALLGALKWLAENGHQSDELEIRMDSKLVVNQVLGTWNCNAPALQAFRRDCLAVMTLFPKVDLKWVKREENFVPDAMINDLYAKAGIQIGSQKYRR